MNRRMVVYTICMILRVEAALMAPALILALVQQEYNAAYGFVVSMSILLGLSLVTLIRRPKTKEFAAREGFLIVSLGWIIAAVMGGMPYFFSGAIDGMVNCIFESVSGFTTTAATILTNVEAMPMSLLYWRSFSLWVGGMGVLVFLLAIIPLTKNTGSALHLLRAESPGPQPDKLVPRLNKSAIILYTMYLVLTLTQFILLLAGGTPLFDSLTVAFSTAGTGGFGIMNDSMASYSAYAQNVTSIFMILFGTNFHIFYFLIMREFTKVLRNEELWTYLAIMGSATVVIIVNVLPLFDGVLGEAAHHVVFQVSSIMTTTGFTTIDFNTWPQFSRSLLIVLMVIGACAGSTGGGIKVARVLILGKSFVRDIRKVVRPHSVATVRMNGRVLDEDMIRRTRSFLIAYVFIALISVLLVSIDSFSFETTMTAVVASMNNIGVGLDLVGPMKDYMAFSGLSKVVLSADMMIGRLEIFPVLMLLMPSAWKR